MSVPFYFLESDYERPLLFGERMFSQSHFSGQFWPYYSLPVDFDASVLNDGWAQFTHLNLGKAKGFFILFVPHAQILETLYPANLLPPLVVEQVRRGDLKLLLWFTHEFFASGWSALSRTMTQLNALLRRYEFTLPGSVVMLHAVKNLKEDFLDRLGHHPVKELVEFRYLDWFHHAYRREIAKGTPVEIAPYDTAGRDKLFLCMNRRARPHRHLLVQWLRKAGLINQGFVSYLEAQTLASARETLDAFPGVDAPDLVGNFITDDPLPSLFLDQHFEANLFFAHNQAFYDASLFSVVTETCFTEKQCFITEKAYKPIYHKHPFLMVGPKGSLAHLRELGYRTFPELFDESYDEMEPSIAKMQVLVDNIARVAAMPDAARKSLFQGVASKVEHNHRLFMTRNRPAELSAFFQGVLNG